MTFPRPKFRQVGLVGIGLLLALAFGSSNAFASCSYPASQHVFSQWNDPASYVPAPDGGFEHGGAGWQLGGSSVVSGNESFFLGGSADSHSLSIPAGSSATSPSFCVEQGFPTFRFMVRNTGLRSATLRVDVTYVDSTGHKTTKTAGYLTAGSTWAPSQKLSIALGLTSYTGIAQSNVQVRFVPQGFGGQFQVDDLFIDPLARR